MASIQEQVRKARESKGLTQSDLGSLIGQPQSSVSRIERGGDLRVSTLLEMVRVLKMEPILIPSTWFPQYRHLSDMPGATAGCRRQIFPW